MQGGSANKTGCKLKEKIEMARERDGFELEAREAEFACMKLGLKEEGGLAVLRGRTKVERSLSRMGEASKVQRFRARERRDAEDGNCASSVSSQRSSRVRAFKQERNAPFEGWGDATRVGLRVGRV